MSKYAEIRNDFVVDNTVYIDAWFSDNNNENGIVIAKVNLNDKIVEYLDEDAKTDKYAQEVIRETLNM